MLGAKEIVREHPAITEDPMAQGLLNVVFTNTGISTGGFPFLGQGAYESLRDSVPHILGMGHKASESLKRIQAIVHSLDAHIVDDEILGHFDRACKVVQRVINTAAITAPPDLWLLRQVLGTLKSIGLVDRLLKGETVHIDPQTPVISQNGDAILSEELVIDLNFLLARGFIHQSTPESFTIADNEQARDVLGRIEVVDSSIPHNLGEYWGRFFSGDQLNAETLHGLRKASAKPPIRHQFKQGHWFATFEEIELGFQMLPIVLGLKAAGLSTRLAEGAPINPDEASPHQPILAKAALQVLKASGCLINNESGAFVATPIGQRVFARGPGPFGIIEAYHGYMRQLPEILKKGRGKAWVQRSANIAASQDANRRTFEKANNSLDALIENHGFKLKIFIEHAVGRGEATRQRWSRSSGEEIHYFGADLEDAAIDAATLEQERGTLPPNMRFIRNADIARPQAVIERLKEEGLDPYGAVMLVGNGFHEARNQEDSAMVEVFKGYHDAGLILLFTEESALSVDDLLSTAWNTYHAGFKYVHERSGQGLRPARKGPPSTLGRPLPASWNECATRAGYVRATSLCSRTRTIFPYRPRNDHNPAISVNHFFIPGSIAEELNFSS